MHWLQRNGAFSFSSDVLRHLTFLSVLYTQVLKAYETQGFSMLLEAFNDTKYLERLTGLDQLHIEGEAALESVDWDNDDEEAGDDS
jgi:hypothetical protein